MPTDKPRFMVTISDEMKRQIDDYRFTHRCRSQTQAIIELIGRGIDVLTGESTDEAKEKQPVITGELSEDELEFITGFASLSASNRRLLLGILALLLQEQAQGGDFPASGRGTS